MDKLLFRLTPILLLGYLSACTYHNEEQLWGIPPPDCETLNLSYSVDIAPIFERHCNDVVCHGNAFSQGRIWLNSHQGVVRTINDGRLLGAIRQENGFNPMPLYSDKLEECSIQKIEAWIAEGMQNN